MRSTDPVRVRAVCQSGLRSALRRPWSPSASGVPTTTAERPSQPGRRQISARTQATKSIDSSYLRMLLHLGDYADPSPDCAGLSKDPFLRPSSTRTGRGAYVAYGSKAPLTESPVEPAAQSGHRPCFRETAEANSRCTGRQRVTPQDQRCADMC